MLYTQMVLMLAILVLLGILLMILETFVPGMIVGAIGALCTLTAASLLLFGDEFASWSGAARAGGAAAVILFTAAALLVWLRCFAVKFWRHGFTLEAASPAAPDDAGVPVTGAVGIALTDLRPLGRADFGGQTREVRCEDGFAPAGAGVCITGREPGNLVVRLTPSPT
jgi:membrane-bound ClpP family serine protease